MINKKSPERNLDAVQKIEAECLSKHAEPFQIERIIYILASEESQHEHGKTTCEGSHDEELIQGAGIRHRNSVIIAADGNVSHHAEKK